MLTLFRPSLFCFGIQTLRCMISISMNHHVLCFRSSKIERAGLRSQEENSRVSTEPRAYVCAASEVKVVVLKRYVVSMLPKPNNDAIPTAGRYLTTGTGRVDSGSATKLFTPNMLYLCPLGLNNSQSLGHGASERCWRANAGRSWTWNVRQLLLSGSV